MVPLTKENFDEVVNGEKNVFVKFYAPVLIEWVGFHVVVWSLSSSRSGVHHFCRLLCQRVPFLSIAHSQALSDRC